MNRLFRIVLMLAVAAARTHQLAVAAEELGTSQQPLETGKKPPTDHCLQGFVWREARPSDHVCVRPETRTAVAEQNRTRAKRWTQGAYGAQTCTEGFVWREAFAGDKVCVTPKFREQTKGDNRAAASRVAKK
jgi:hypothetical protein